MVDRISFKMYLQDHCFFALLCFVQLFGSSNVSDVA
jgi:hypothetical protein